jgi:hypothetical protein
MSLAYRNLDTPDSKRSFTHGDMHVVTLAGTTFVRATFGPGWRWSADVKPGAGTDSCQVAHNSYVVSGRFAVRMDDGTQAEFGPGDATVISPGHDAWVVGRGLRPDRHRPRGIDPGRRRAGPDGQLPPVRHRVPRPAHRPDR